MSGTGRPPDDGPLLMPLLLTQVHRSRGGSRNSFGPEFFEGGGGFRVQVRGNFHILTSKKKKTSEGGGGG